MCKTSISGKLHYVRFRLIIRAYLQILSRATGQCSVAPTPVLYKISQRVADVLQVRRRSFHFTTHRCHRRSRSGRLHIVLIVK